MLQVHCYMQQIIVLWRNSTCLTLHLPSKVQHSVSKTWTFLLTAAELEWQQVPNLHAISRAESSQQYMYIIQ